MTAARLLSHIARPRSIFSRPLYMSSNTIAQRLASTSAHSKTEARSSISALVAHIQEAAKVLEEHYSTHPSSSGVPSLEHPEEHSLDQHVMDREARAAVQTIEGACAQLADTVGNPNHILMNRFMEYYYPTCINIALMYKIPDLLQEKPEGMSTSEIGEKTGIHPRKIGRILRMLASRHLFKEVSEDVFANNRLSIHLLSSNPLYDFGLHFADESINSSVLLPALLTDKDWGHSFEQNETAFNKFTGCTGTMWDHHEYDHPIGTNRGTRFGRGLIAWAAALESTAVVHGYPWKDLGENATFCDLGSGVGTMSMALAKAHPNLRFVLHDMPGRLKQAKEEIWPERCPEALAQNRVEFVPLDFFNKPPSPGCDVYYLKNIVHDWSDEMAIKLLSNIRKAMGPNSKIFVQEHILQHGHRVPDEETHHKQAPHPILPNYGAGRIRHHSLDIHLLNMLNSEVRTLPHFVKLGHAAGLEFVKSWDIGETSVLEYKLL